jgi:hypothetical protein
VGSFLVQLEDPVHHEARLLLLVLGRSRATDLAAARFVHSVFV